MKGIFTRQEIFVKRKPTSDSTIGIICLDSNLRWFERLAPIIAELPTSVSLAKGLEMCFVARGFLDAYIDSIEAKPADSVAVAT